MNIKISLIIVAFILSLGYGTYAQSAYASEAEAQAAGAALAQRCMANMGNCNCAELKDAKAVTQCESMKAQAEAFIQKCTANIDTCNCSEFGEEQIVQACNMKISEIRTQIKAFAQQCYNDLEACDCSQFNGNPRAMETCEQQKEGYLKKAQAIVLQCADDPFKCDCSSLGEYAGKCQAQVEIGKEVKTKCENNLETCDCSPIERPEARTACESAKNYALDFKNKFQKQCEDNLETCDCATVPSATGRTECEDKKQKAIKQATTEMNDYLNKCFSDIQNCNCDELPKENYKAYCKQMLGYGLSCMNEGLFCEKLDEMDLTPPGLPEFLKPFFRQSLKQKIDEEKQKGLQKASEIAGTCVTDPEKCDCSQIPVYARDFCTEKKTLQLKCIYEKDIPSCMKLDESVEVVPQGVPEFIKGPLDALLRPLVLMQKERIKGKYAQETKDLIMECIDDIEKCRCWDVPPMYRDFCNHKVQLVRQCYAKDYGACFTVMDEKNVPEDVPVFIRIFVEGEADAKVKAKAEQMFNQMKDPECTGLTLQECRQKLGK